VRDVRDDPRFARLRRPRAEEKLDLAAQSKEVLASLREDLRRVVDAPGNACEIGQAIGRSAIDGVAPTGASGLHCHRLYWLWSTLAGRAEDPARRDQADVAMRRAAREWLELPEYETAWRAYFDRWLHEELGVRRDSYLPVVRPGVGLVSPEEDEHSRI